MPSIFAPLQAAPDDPILGLTELYKNDPCPEKVNLGAGVFQDEDGKLPLMKAVAEAEKRMAASGMPHGYIPMSGLPAYCTAVQKLVFGDTHEAVLAGRICTVQSIGGTGALHMAGLFAHLVLGLAEIVVPDPTWGNHITIFAHTGLKVSKYPYYDKATGGLDFDAMTAHLRTLEPGTAVLLHACCHNPSGVDLTQENWKTVVEIVRERKLFPILDIAYQGFGQGLVEDAFAPRYFADEKLDFLVCSSCSKNFSLYGERAGGLHVVTPNAAEAAVVQSILKSLVRAEYSNPPTHGARIVDVVLNDPELHQLWVEELTGMRGRIHAMRNALTEAGTRIGVDLSFAVRQAGMFSFTGLNPEQMQALREDYSVYGVKNGRICVSGLNTRNVEYVAKAIAAVL